MIPTKTKPRSPAQDANLKKGPLSLMKGDTPFTSQVKALVSPETSASVAAIARVDGVTKADIVRRAVELYLRDRQFV